MSSTTVYVKNIASATQDKEITDFFSFCGKVQDVKVTSEGETKSAEIRFEKETAAKTALLLDKTRLGDSQINVTGTTEAIDDAPGAGSTTPPVDPDNDELMQEQKPRARIFAEYLAHGYNVSNYALEKAIDLDQRHGMSSRFLKTLQRIDEKYQARDRVKTADQSYGISHRANGVLSGFSSYFEKASHSNTGKCIVKFYTDTTRQVADIHNEAKRLADLKRQEHGGSSYKAAGLDRVFGPEKTRKPKESASPNLAPGDLVNIGSTQTPTAPANVPANEEVVTKIPKDDSSSKS